MKYIKPSKVISLALAGAMMLSTAENAFAIKNVSFTDNGNGTATVTAEDTDKIAVAQYDDAGALKNFGISSLMGEKQTVTVDFDSDRIANVYSFTDWSTLASDKRGHKIGNETLIYSSFDNVRESSCIINDLGFEIDNNYDTTDRDGNATKAMLIKGTTNSTPFNIQFGGADTGESDCVVFEYDLMLNDVDTAFISYIKATKPDGSSGAWQRLWGAKPDDEDSATLDFGENRLNAQSIVADTWYRLSVAVDYHTSTIKYYFNNVLMGEENIVSDIHPDVYSPDIFYIHGPMEGSADFVVDNVRVYEGTQPRDNIKPYEVKLDLTKSTIVEKDETAQREALAGKYVVHTRSGVAIDTEGNKTLLSNTPYTDNGAIYVPLEELCTAWGITVPGGVTTNGDGYAKLSDLAKALGLNLYTPEVEINSGLVVLASDFTAPEDITLQSLNNYAYFLRASDDVILEAYNNSSAKNVHPRLLATQSDFDRLRAMYEAGTDEAFMTWAEEVIAFADSRMGNGDPDYNELTSSGRTLQRKLKGDIYAWAMAYHLTGDMKYVKETVAELTCFCNFPTWYPEDHLHIIETMDAFAIAYDWLYNALTADERKLFEENMYEEGFFFSYQAFLSRTSAMGNAFYASNNHGTVCNGGMAMAAVAFMDVYPKECAWFISNAMKGMEYNIDKWNTGAWYEGAGYWEYAAAYTVKFIESLRGTLGSDFGFATLEGLDITAEKEIGMHGALGIYNYADAGSGEFYSPEMLWLGSEYNNSAVATKVVKEYDSSFPQSHRRNGESISLALLWYDPEMIDETATFQNDYFYEDLNVITMREGWNKDDTFAGIKAGVLNEAHSQLDSGSFIFESDGIRWLQDLGPGSYEDGYFDTSSGGRRWLSIQARAEGHSTVSTNPGDIEDMNIGKSGATAKMTLVDQNDNGAIVTVDMSEVLFDVKNAKRGFYFTDNRQSLVVRDEIAMFDESVLADESFDGKTTTKVFGANLSHYEIVSGKNLGLDATDDVAKLTGDNNYFNSNSWNANTGSKVATYEFDLYFENVKNVFQFYPTGSNRYGLQIGGDESGTIKVMQPGWEAESIGKTVTAGKWYKFAVEYDMQNGQMLIYMDDALIHTETGLSTTANAPADHYFNGRVAVKGTYIYVNNVKCYTYSYSPDADTDAGKAIAVDENFDGKTTTGVFGTNKSNYEIVSGSSLGLKSTDSVAKLTGENNYFNSNKWNANTGTTIATYEFEVYTDNVKNALQFYPTGSNRYGLQVGGDENGTIYVMMPNWETTSTGKTMEAGSWHKFAVEYNMTKGNMLIYMDEELIYTQTGLDTTAFAPADHYFNLRQGVAGTYVYVNNLKCYATSYSPGDVVYWRLITDPNATVTVDADTNTVTITRDGKSCKVEYAVDGGKIVQQKFEKPIVSIIDNARPISSKYGRFVLKITTDTGDVNITAKVTPDSATNTTLLSDYIGAISDWELN